MTEPLRIGLPKGRIFDATEAIFAETGLDLSSIRDGGRRLVHRIEGTPFGDVEVLTLRASDVAVYVEHGVCHLGAAGYDTILEQRPDVLLPIDLGIGRCRMCVCGRPEVNPFALDAPRLATKYGRVAEEYFSARGVGSQIIKLSGAIEIAPLVGLADGIVDVVETGETLRKNGLVEHETMFEISTRMVVNRAALRLRMTEVRGLLDAVQSVLTAREVRENQENRKS